MHGNVICGNHLPWVDLVVRSATMLTMSFRCLFDRPGFNYFLVSLLLFLVTNAGVDIKP